MGAYNIPTPLRQLMTERDSLKAQKDKLINDYDILLDEKQKAVAEFDERLNELIARRDELQAQWQQYYDAVEAMKAQYQITVEEQIPPEEDPTATQ